MDHSLPTHTVPSPPAAVVSGTKRVIQHIGGRVHEAPHADRISNPSPLAGVTAEPQELCTCNQITIADVPQGNTRPAVRVCIVCDSVPRWPRIVREAQRAA